MSVAEERSPTTVKQRRSFTPYNAQATVHLYDAFWGLLLPVTVHGRVSDIWRAYLTQKLLWDVGQVITFTPAHVVHDRVAHDYLRLRKIQAYGHSCCGSGRF